MLARSGTSWIELSRPSRAPSDPGDPPGPFEVPRSTLLDWLFDLASTTLLESRPKRSLEGPDKRFSIDFGSIWGSIFVVFQGYVAQAGQLIATIAEPCFVWPWPHETAFADFAKTPKIDKIRGNIAPSRLRDCVERSKPDFFASGRDSASI